MHFSSDNFFKELSGASKAQIFPITCLDGMVYSSEAQMRQNVTSWTLWLTWRPGINEEKQEKVINTNMVPRDRVRFVSRRGNVRDDNLVGATFWQSRGAGHRAFLEDRSGREVLAEEEEWDCPLWSLIKVRGWRGRTLTRRCGFSWWPLPGS